MTILETVIAFALLTVTFGVALGSVDQVADGPYEADAAAALQLEAELALGRISDELRRSGTVEMGGLAYPEISDDSGVIDTGSVGEQTEEPVGGEGGAGGAGGGGELVGGEAARGDGEVRPEEDDGAVEVNGTKVQTSAPRSGDLVFYDYDQIFNIYGDPMPAGVNPVDRDILLDNVIRIDMLQALKSGVKIVQGDFAVYYVPGVDTWGFEYQGGVAFTASTPELLKETSAVERAGLRVTRQDTTVIMERLRRGPLATRAQREWVDVLSHGTIDANGDGTSDGQMLPLPPRIDPDLNAVERGTRSIAYAQPSYDANTGEPRVDLAGRIIWESNETKLLLGTAADGTRQLELWIADELDKVLCKNVEAISFDSHSTDPTLRKTQLRIMITLKKRDRHGRYFWHSAQTLVKMRNYIQ